MKSNSFITMFKWTRGTFYLLGKHDRSVQANKNILYSFGIKGYSLALQFTLVPITLGYLDTYQYGIWLTIASIVGWVSFFDVGIGNGLRNKLSEALAIKNYKLARSYVSTCYFLVASIFLFVILIFCAINPFLDWSKILNVVSSRGVELRNIMLLVFIFFCLRFVFNLIGKVLFADQRPAINNLMGPLGNTLAMICILVLMQYVESSLFWIAIIYTCAPLIILILFNLILFGTRYRFISPSFETIDFKHSKQLIGLGLKFFVIQLASIITFSTANIIIVQLFGPNEVTTYNIAYKYFTLVIMINSIVASTYWSAFTEAYVKNDINWIRSSIKKLNIIAYLLIGVLLIAALATDYVIELWIGEVLKIPTSLVLIMCVYVSINLLMAPYVMFINGIGKIKLQLYSAVVSIVMTIPLAIFFCKTLNFGLAGVVAAMICTTLPTAILWRIQYSKIINGSAAGIWNK